MKIFNNKNQENTPKSKRLINVNAIVKGGYFIAIIAAVCVIAVFLNIGTSLLDKRGHLTVDLSPKKANTISEDNRKFLKSIDKEVNIVVLCTEDEYVSTYAQYLQEYYNIASSEDYFSQSVSLLRQYEEANKKINVEYVDITGVKARKIQEKYPSAFFGDIYVEVENKHGTKSTKLVTYDKIYPYEDPGYAQYGFSSYQIYGNNLETALSSAINALVKDEDETIGIIEAHGYADIVSLFEEKYVKQLEYNGFASVRIEGVELKEIPEEVSVIAIVAPQTDFLESEIEIISKWLENDGKKGHSLIFCPAYPITGMTNLEQFLEEWGVVYGDGILYQTDLTQYNTDPTVIYSHLNDNVIVDDIQNGVSGTMLTQLNVPIEFAFERFGSRVTTVIASTNNKATVRPMDSGDDWEPSKDAKTQTYPTITLTTDSVTVDGKVLSSYVVAFSSIYMPMDVGSSVKNIDVSINTARYIAGLESNAQKLYVTRVLETETFTDKVTAAGVKTITVIFLIIAPLSLVVAGGFVWIRRRRR